MKSGGGSYMCEQPLIYLQKNREKLLQSLYAFLSIPSVSTDRAYVKDVQKAADFLERYLQEIGFENVCQQETKGHPLVYAEYRKAGPHPPTVLVYGHYDVQPADPLELWDSDPSQPEIRNHRRHERESTNKTGKRLMYLAFFEE